jgi:UDP-2,3-diacylglucosamine pyrophosphatase LpxH
MQQKPRCQQCPEYQGIKWIQIKLPEETIAWKIDKKASMKKEGYHHNAYNKDLQQALSKKPWKWPKRTVYFISDIHADNDAFMASLVASGGIRKLGPNDADFELTTKGRKSRFLIGGDCFEKGPGNLRVLRSIRKLQIKGARMHILAGNHDVRNMLGFRSIGMEHDTRTEHFFIRMGPKAVSFLKEIYDEYLQGEKALRDIPSSYECTRILYPSRRWFTDFPLHAVWAMPDVLIERELQRMSQKIKLFWEECKRVGLNPRMVYAAAKKWQSLFLHPKGKFAWFYKDMQLSYREGSFLFIHAGLDDNVARIIKEKGIKYLNKVFSKEINKNPFDFYFSPLANTIRTKYRDIDRPFTRQGARLLRKSGVQVIVHGHDNLSHGQRIILRKGIVNFECDATMDRGSREKESMPGTGASVTIFKPEGAAVGISTDYPKIKVFDPSTIQCTP